MAENNSSEQIEDEATRHRRERRELQSTIQQLKKSINKNDKTRKKKIDSEIKALEEAFEKRWTHFNEISTTTVSNKSSASTQVDEHFPEVSLSKTKKFNHILYLEKKLSNYSLIVNNIYHAKHVG